MRIVVTPGEPAGIGPDLVLAMASQSWPVELVAVADPDMLAARAKVLGLAVELDDVDWDHAPAATAPGRIAVDPVVCDGPVTPGTLNVDNAGYVLATLDRAVDLVQKGQADALVTGPVHKGVINDSGRAFTGHTDYLADRCGSPPPVMMLTTSDGDMRVALATVHMPLSCVSGHLGAARLDHVFATTSAALERFFLKRAPHMLVAGLNPHAGEQGYLGREEIETIAPAIERAHAAGHAISGPYSADTLFIDANRRAGDVVIAMYHDQGLPVIKYAGFGDVVNVSLGLPIVRTSVDHGTALELAATGHADAFSMDAAIGVALNMLRVDAKA